MQAAQAVQGRAGREDGVKARESETEVVHVTSGP